MYVGHEATKLINQQKNNFGYWKCGHSAKREDHRMGLNNDIINKPSLHSALRNQLEFLPTSTLKHNFKNLKISAALTVEYGVYL